MILTEIPITAVVLCRWLSFGLSDDVREFSRSAPCSVLVARRFPYPFKYARPRAKVTAKKGSSVFGDSECGAVRKVIE